jgi:hypothetical protein
MQINEKQIREILKDQKKVFQFLYKFGEVFGDAVEIYEILDLDKTTEVIWDIYQIPQDNMPNFDPEKKIEKGEFIFCRDGLDVVVQDYFDGNISLDAYIKELKMWSEEFRHIYVNQIANGVKNAK